MAGVDPAAVRYNIALFFLTSSEGYGDDVSGWFDEYLLRAPTDTALQQYTKEMLSGETDRQIEQEITNLPEYGQNPPAATASTAQGLPDYYQPGSSPSSRQATVAAKDAVFSQLGN